MQYRAVASLVVLGCGGGASGQIDAPAGTGDGGGGDGAVPVDAPANLEPERWLVDKSECPAAFQATAPVQGANTGFQVAGQSRAFTLLRPTNGATGPRPLLVGFNGTSENGASFSTRARLAEFAAKGFIVVAPSSVGNGAYWPIWDAMRAPGSEAAANKDLALFDTLIRCTAAHFEVDKKRIYVAGHSAGGIFSNRVLRSRADVVAGGIVGSGIWSFTGTGAGAPPLDPVFAIVTWGGDNDGYSGTTPNGVTVPYISFVEQASLASRFYEGQPGSSQVACRGNNIGHAWLQLNGWFADALLAHPKGAPADAPLPPLPSTSTAVCSNDAYVLPPAPPLVCRTATPASCQAACQFMADCIVENQTTGSVMEDQTTALGLTPTSCGTCVSNCEAVAGTTANQQVLTCLANAQASATCGPGIEGSLPFMNALNSCCSGRTDSSLCVSTCTEFNRNEVIAPFFPVCASIAP